MKANELMIGDWVSYIGKDFNDFADKISGIIDGCVTLDKEMIHRSIDKIHPIPITTEILEKNGFVEFMPHNWKIVIDNIMIELREPEHNMAIWLDWDEHDTGTYASYMLPRPDYVHELQHALRLVEVEKEIEL